MYCYVCREKDEQTSHHLFPKQDRNLRKDWLKAFNLREVDVFTNTRICGKHFEPKCFSIRAGTQHKSLITGSVPTLLLKKAKIKRNVEAGSQNVQSLKSKINKGYVAPKQPEDIDKSLHIYIEDFRDVKTNSNDIVIKREISSPSPEKQEHNPFIPQVILNVNEGATITIPRDSNCNKHTTIPISQIRARNGVKRKIKEEQRYDCLKLKPITNKQERSIPLAKETDSREQRLCLPPKRRVCRPSHLVQSSIEADLDSLTRAKSNYTLALRKVDELTRKVSMLGKSKKRLIKKVETLTGLFNHLRSKKLITAEAETVMQAYLKNAN